MRDRRTALNRSPRLQVGKQRTDQAPSVDAMVFIEAAVFGRQDRLRKVLGQHVERHVIARHTAFGDQRAVMANDANDGGPAVLTGDHRMR